MPSRTALRLGLRWLVPVRWCAVASQALATLTLFAASGGFPIAPALLTLVPTILSNVAIGRPDAKPSENTVFALLLLDVVTLSVWLVLAGGASNPWSALYLVEVALAAFMLGEARPWIVTAAAAIGYGATHLLAGDEGGHVHGGAAFDSHLEGMYLAYVVSSVLVTFFVSRMAEALHERETELEAEREHVARIEKVAALTTLAAGAAHELGTPLATIAVAAKELERDLAQSSAPTHIIEDARLVREEVQRCRAILDRMAMRAGHLIGKAPERIALSSIASSVLDSLGAASARVDLEVDEGEVLQLEHALVTIAENLVRNGLDASPSGSRVRLALRLRDADIEIEAVDEGEGMDETTRARAFEPFFTTKAAGAGMGLGLFLVHSLAEDLGGKISLESELGRGTKIRVLLPLLPSPRA